MAKPRSVMILVVIVVGILGLAFVALMGGSSTNTAEHRSLSASAKATIAASTTVAEPPDWFQITSSTSDTPTTTLAPTTIPTTTTNSPAVKAAVAPHPAQPQPAPPPPAGQAPAPAPCTYRGEMVQASSGQWAGWVYYVDSSCVRHHVPDPGTRDCLIHQGISGPFEPSDPIINALPEASPKYCMGTFLRLSGGWVWVIDCSDGQACTHAFRRHASGTCNGIEVVDITQDVTDGLPTGADFGPSECGRF